VSRRCCSVPGQATSGAAGQACVDAMCVVAASPPPRRRQPYGSVRASVGVDRPGTGNVRWYGNSPVWLLPSSDEWLSKNRRRRNSRYSLTLFKRVQAGGLCGAILNGLIRHQHSQQEQSLTRGFNPPAVHKQTCPVFILHHRHRRCGRCTTDQSERAAASDALRMTCLSGELHRNGWCCLSAAPPPPRPKPPHSRLPAVFS
jgi:hypothetical protein